MKKGKYTWAAAGELLGVHYSTVLRADARLRAKGETPRDRDWSQFNRMLELSPEGREQAAQEIDLALVAESLDKTRRQKQRHMDEKRVLNGLDRTRHRALNALDLLLEYADTRELKLEVPALAPRPEREDAEARVQTQVYSDWHRYGTIRKGPTLGRTNSDPAVVGDAIQSIGEQNIEELLDLNSKHRVERVVMQFLGDDIPGVIHGLQGVMLYDAIRASWNVGVEKARLIQMVAAVAHPLGIPVDVVFQTGNHGRTNAKLKAQDCRTPEDSFDYLAALVAVGLIPEDSGINLVLPTALFTNWSVLGQNYCSTHGDFLSKGVHFLDRARRTLQEIQALEDQRFAGIFFGHFHQYGTLPDVFASGTLEGTNEWAMANFRSAETPSQLSAILGPDGSVSARAVTPQPLRGEPLFREAWTDQRDAKQEELPRQGSIIMLDGAA